MHHKPEVTKVTVKKIVPAFTAGTKMLKHIYDYQILILFSGATYILSPG